MKIKNIIRNDKGQFIKVWDRDRIKCKCLFCGKEFETVESRIKVGKGKYCSLDCYNKVKKGRRQSPKTEFKKGQISQVKGIKRNWQSKEKHWNWKGGINPINDSIRKSLKYKEWRISVFKRDNYTCQECGAKSGNGKAVYLEAHHIKEFCDYPKLRFNINNGITLCKKCHNKTKRGRKI